MTCRWVGPVSAGPDARGLVIIDAKGESMQREAHWRPIVVTPKASSIESLSKGSYPGGS